MDKRVKWGLIGLAAVVVAYFGYQWWQNRSSSGGSGVPQLGTNLNSVAPELIAGSTGPNSGLNNYGGGLTLNVSNPVTQQSSTTSTGGTGPSTTSPPSPASGQPHRWLSKPGMMIPGGAKFRLITPPPNMVPGVS